MVIQHIYFDGRSPKSIPNPFRTGRTYSNKTDVREERSVQESYLKLASAVD